MKFLCAHDWQWLCVQFQILNGNTSCVLIGTNPFGLILFYLLTLSNSQVLRIVKNSGRICISVLMYGWWCAWLSCGRSSQHQLQVPVSHANIEVDAEHSVMRAVAELFYLALRFVKCASCL